MGFEPTIITFLIVCPLVGIAGFIDAIAGGGGLVSLPAYMIAGLPAHAAIATNKMSSTMGTAVATGRFIRLGYVPWKQALPCVPAAFVGSFLGAQMALMLSDFYLKVAMLVILPVIAVYLLRGHAFGQVKDPLPEGKTIVIGLGVALVVGIYDSFYGPGTGTFLILLLQMLAHIPLKTANGITKIINLSTNVTALVVFLVNGQVLLMLGIAAGALNMVGNYLGSKFFDKSGAKGVKPFMIAVLCIFFVRVVLDLAGVL